MAGPGAGNDDAAAVAILPLFELERIEINLFRGPQPDMLGERVFGGQVAAQSLVAANHTVDPAHRVHSLHSYFLRMGDPTIPIVYDVDRIRDGRSFSTRRVVAIQRGEAIFNLQASFQVDERGHEHQAAMPDVPPPEALPSPDELRAVDPDAPMFPPVKRWRVDMRHIGGSPMLRTEPGPPRQTVWVRVGERMPDDHNTHAAMLTFVSDMALLATPSLPHRGAGEPAMMVASLDHLVWFHRPHRLDEWTLYDMDSPSASGARGFSRGAMYNRSGDLVASIAQEGLIRPLRRAPDTAE